MRRPLRLIGTSTFFGLSFFTTIQNVFPMIATQNQADLYITVGMGQNSYVACNIAHRKQQSELEQALKHFDSDTLDQFHSLVSQITVPQTCENQMDPFHAIESNAPFAHERLLAGQKIVLVVRPWTEPKIEDLRKVSRGTGVEYGTYFISHVVQQEAISRALLAMVLNIPNLQRQRQQLSAPLKVNPGSVPPKAMGWFLLRCHAALRSLMNGSTDSPQDRLARAYAELYVIPDRNSQEGYGHGLFVRMMEKWIVGTLANHAEFTEEDVQNLQNLLRSPEASMADTLQTSLNL